MDTVNSSRVICIAKGVEEVSDLTYWKVQAQSWEASIKTRIKQHQQESLPPNAMHEICTQGSDGSTTPITVQCTPEQWALTHPLPVHLFFWLQSRISRWSSRWHFSSNGQARAVQLATIEQGAWKTYQNSVTIQLQSLSLNWSNTRLVVKN